MNKPEIIQALSEKTGMTKNEAAACLDAFTDIVTNELKKGGSVKLVGFGTFEVSNRAERNGRNPQTGEPMTIPATKTPHFKPGKLLKDAVK